MANSPRLSLPYLVSGQAQKEVTHNDALNDLDTLTQLCVINRTTSTPPSSPNDGDAYIIGASPTGAWTEQTHALAYFYSGWRIKPAQAGWRAYVQAENTLFIFDGTLWKVFSQTPAAGSVSAPAYSFTGDSDTGIYSPAANQCAITTGGVQAVSINASQIINCAKPIQVAGNQAISGPAFSVYVASAQTITTSTLTKVAFNTEEFDTNNNFDAASLYRFTPTVGGYYQINANTNFSAASVAGGRACHLSL